jgi:uncharacterized membrane protein
VLHAVAKAAGEFGYGAQRAGYRAPLTAGVALFIAMPVLGVLVMLGAFIFIRTQDYRLVIVAAVVLITILAGLGIGLSFSNPLAH